jgi:hypothetical protein
MTSGRSVSAIRSRIADDLIDRVLVANSAAYRSMSRAVDRFRVQGGSWELLTPSPGGSSSPLHYRHWTSRYSTVFLPFEMHLAFDIFQGLGIAAAAGIRPFLPALVTGALAAGDIQINFTGTNYAFLEKPPFLFAVLVASCVLAVAEWRWRSAADRRPVVITLFVVSLAMGAVLFAGALSQNGHTVWPGWVAGAACARVGAAATIPRMLRVRARLAAEAAGATALFADGASIVVAGLSVLAPPVGLIALVALAWLWLSGRRRQPEKYAGLRILR